MGLVNLESLKAIIIFLGHFFEESRMERKFIREKGDSVINGVLADGEIRGAD